MKTDLFVNEEGEWIAGVDEAGRGPLAGPVVAAAVILDPACPLEGLADSKTLSPRKRDALFAKICASALAYAIAEANVAEIEKLNILQASLLAMQRAIDALSHRPSKILVDGPFAPAVPIPCETIIRGDALVPAISAASILAKVHRDRLMRQWHEHYPLYGFHQHVGYGTVLHLEALQQYGPCPIHRRSYAPVKKYS